MPTDNCYRRRKTMPLEEELIFAIRERFPDARLKGKQFGEQWKWRVEEGPFKDIVYCDSIERAWCIAYCFVHDVSTAEMELMIKQMRKGARK